MVSKLLFRVRSNIFTARGGDTVLLEGYIKALSGSIEQIYVDGGSLLDLRTGAKIELHDLKMVHLFNFALPDALSRDVKFFKEAGKAVVVTTLAEDVENYKAREFEHTARLTGRTWQSMTVQRNDNSAAIELADCFLVTGARERDYLVSLGANSDKVQVVNLISSLSTVCSESPIKSYNLTEPYVLCVGRLESRKNQLSLLHALAGVAFPVVFAGGGSCYQPEYAESVRRFNRAGRTIILPEVTAEQLSTLFKEAAVHVLPSFCELPGLVSIESYLSGTPVVVTNTGSTYDYLTPGEEYGIFGCQADDIPSIQKATLEGYYFGKYARSKISAEIQASLREKVDIHKLSRQLIAIYQEAQSVTAAPQSLSMPQTVSNLGRLSVTLENAAVSQIELESAEGMMDEHKFAEAQAMFMKYLESNPNSVRGLRGLGSSLIAQGRAGEARQFFEIALENDSRDPKSWSGVGMCYFLQEDFEQAYHHIVRSLDMDPFHVMTIKTLVELAFRMNRFNHLIGSLERFLDYNQSGDLSYCLAAALYKVGARSESLKVLRGIRDGSPSESLLQKVGELEALLDCSVDVAKVRAFLTINCDGAEDEALLEHLDGMRKEKEELHQECIDLIEKNQNLALATKIGIANIWGEVCTLRGLLEQATTIFETVIEVNRSKTNNLEYRALNGLAIIALTRSDVESAIRFFDESLNLHDNDVAFSGLGLCQELKGDIELSISYYNKALTLNTTNRRALISLATLQPDSNLRSQIEVYLDQNPLDMEVNKSYGHLLRSLGDIEAAENVDRCISALS